jgi:hypothetical protein
MALDAVEHRDSHRPVDAQGAFVRYAATGEVHKHEP